MSRVRPRPAPLGADFLKSLVKPPAQLLRIELLVGSAAARDDRAGGRDARQPGEADQFPGHPHVCVG